MTQEKLQKNNTVRLSNSNSAYIDSKKLAQENNARIDTYGRDKFNAESDEVMSQMINNLNRKTGIVR